MLVAVGKRTKNRIIMDKILLDLKIVQEKSVPTGKFDGHYRVYSRLNPYNPLSYITLAISIVVYLVLYGVVGLHKDLSSNPFKWH